MNNSYGPAPKSMDFGESIGTCLRKYFVFEGRASRSEFWYFVLFSCICSFVIGILVGMSGGTSNVAGLLTLPFLIPSWAVGARRLHDTEKTGWLQLLCLTIIGIIPLIIWWANEGTTKGYTESIKRRTSVRNYNEAPRSRSGKADLTDELEELQGLYEDGTLSEAQFKKAKEKLLK